MDVDDRGRATAASYSEAMYPRLSVTLTVHPVNCGFDGPGKTELGGLPSDFGYWSGPAYELVRAQKGLTPVQGRGMLHFLPPPAPSSTGDSAVWQIVDLRNNKDVIGRGGMTITLSAYFNRIRSAAHTGKTFSLAMAAYRGEPKDVENLWSRRHELALATAESQVVTDDNPLTWERLEAITALPSETDFVIVEMRAIAPDDQESGTNPFPGHFADLIDCTLTGPLEAATP